MKKNYVVIDTNVLISAGIGQNNFPSKIFREIVFTNEIKICISAEILAEYEEVIVREKFAKYDGFKERATELVEGIKNIAVFFVPKIKLDILNDSDDNMFLEVALEAGANYIVTGNSKDFIMKEFRGTLILTPKEFYEEWVSERMI